MIIHAVKNRDIGSLDGLVYNSLQPVTRELYPAVGAMIERLNRRPGVRAVLMSGSGSAVFGIFASRRDAAAAVSSLKRPRCRVFLARTI
jgi:4-diphosphocytidyl-2C-methyl-D-erythritol kinase